MINLISPHAQENTGRYNGFRPLYWYLTNRSSDVCYRHKADITIVLNHVRFRG
jgi:hypothetical protein